MDIPSKSQRGWDYSEYSKKMYIILLFLLEYYLDILRGILMEYSFMTYIQRIFYAEYLGRNNAVIFILYIEISTNVVD